MDNKVVKVLHINDTIVFCITYEYGLYSWEISKQDWLAYWENKAQGHKQLYLNSLVFSPVNCDTFINDPVNDTLGSSTGSFNTIEDILKYYEIV